jgi:hypothetical protein
MFPAMRRPMFGEAQLLSLAREAMPVHSPTREAPAFDTRTTTAHNDGFAALDTRAALKHDVLFTALAATTPAAHPRTSHVQRCSPAEA